MEPMKATNAKRKNERCRACVSELDGAMPRKEQLMGYTAYCPPCAILRLPVYRAWLAPRIENDPQVIPKSG